MATKTTKDAPVQADAPVKKARARKAAEPKAPKEPRNTDPAARFDEIDERLVQKDYKIPAELKPDKSVLRIIVKKSGKFSHRAAGYMTPREIMAALHDVYPIKAKGYGFEREVSSQAELIELAKERARAYVEKEKVRAADRNARRNEELGELSDKFKGNDLEARIGMIRARLGEETWAVLEPEKGAQRIEGHTVYDLDGRGGRRAFYTLVPAKDLKKDGTLVAKPTGKTLLLSPRVWVELIEGDAELSARIKVPAGFSVVPPKVERKKAEPKPKAERKPRKARKVANADLLEQAEEAPEETSAPEAEEAVDIDDLLS